MNWFPSFSFIKLVLVCEKKCTNTLGTGYDWPLGFGFNLFKKTLVTIVPTVMWDNIPILFSSPLFAEIMVWTGQIFESANMTWFGLVKYLITQLWHGLDWSNIWTIWHDMVWTGQIFEPSDMTWFGLVVSKVLMLMPVCDLLIPKHI